MVDPLDGTVNFTSGIPLYSVSIGLLVNGRPVLGVVHAPAMKETFFAEVKKGAFLNNNKISVSKTNRLTEAVISGGVAPHFKKSQMEKAITLLSDIVPYVRGVRIFESGALIKCYVACGRVDAHLGVKTDPFGSAASKVIIEEAGGVISDFHGKSWSLEMRTLACSNKKLHAKILSFV